MAKAAVDSKTSTRAAAADPFIGKTLDGRFKIIEKLGAGGMGTVYKAVQAPLDRLVALKVLNANYDSKRDPGFQKRFFLEASVTSKLRHPNTITVIDYGKTQDGIYYLAMEFVVGVTLAHVLVTQGALPWGRVLAIAQQVARSLREAHKAGVIHRDLKPANVMLCTEETDTDQVKVLDFGLVKTFGDDHDDFEVSTELTQQGVFLGSPQYMAPEQARNIADPRSDIYSLGVVLYQMLTGKPPFYADQSIDVIVKHMREPPPPFAQVRPDLDIPAEVEALVMRCLEKEPIRRYQTMDELLDGLRAINSSGNISNSFAGRGPSPTPPPLNQVSGSGVYRQGAQTSGAQRLPQSGAYRATTTTSVGSGVRSGPGLRPGSGAHGLLDERPTGVVSAARAAPASSSRKWIPLGIFGASAIVGVAVVLMMLREPSAPAAPATSSPPASAAATTAAAGTAAPAAAAAVRFKVASEPPGATVTADGKVLGTTPVSFEVPPLADGSASANLTFALDGYETAVVTAGGPGPEVAVSHTLRKVAAAATTASAPARPKPSPPPPPTDKKQKVTGYKDDPY